MTRPHVQKQQDSYSYSTEEVADGRAGTGATEAATVQKKGDECGRGYSGATEAEDYTVHCQNSIIDNITPRQYPPTSSRGGKSMIYCSMLLQICPHSNLLDGLVQKYDCIRGNLRKLGACFAGISNPRARIRPSVATVRAAVAVLGLLCAGASYAGATPAVSATVTVTAREWWMMGMAAYSTVLLMWLLAAVAVVCQRLGKLFESNLPIVRNVTLGNEFGEWLSESENGPQEPALLVEQPCSFKEANGWCPCAASGINTQCFTSKAGAQ